MPEAIVSMPAHNTARYIRTAIRSVLAQEGVSFTLVVLDDASTDDTHARAAAIEDPRLVVLRNETRGGIARCHNRILRETESPFVIHVDSDDVVHPGAFRKMIDVMESDPSVGQAHCHFYTIRDDGLLDVSERSRQERALRTERDGGLDYPRELIRTGCVINHLRTYRRSVLDALGPFNERVPIGVDYEMALRIADAHRIRLVPEFLYSMRVHETNTTGGFRFKNLAFLWNRVRAWHHVWRRQPDHFLHRHKGLMLRFVAHRLALIARLDLLVRPALRSGGGGR